MRLGVLDVGSNTVHLLVVDAHRGAHPMPMTSQKSMLRLAEQMDAHGKITREGADHLVRTVHDAVGSALTMGCEDLMAFATSAVRDASNASAVLTRVYAETGVELEVLSGEQEAILTFLAVRRWCGWSAGRLLMVDIGGGSLELASGIDEEPDVAVSLPLGAGRLTRSCWHTIRRAVASWQPCVTISSSSLRARPESYARPTPRTGWWALRRPSGRWPGSPELPHRQPVCGSAVRSPTSACAS